MGHVAASRRRVADLTSDPTGAAAAPDPSSRRRRRRAAHPPAAAASPAAATAAGNEPERRQAIRRATPARAARTAARATHGSGLPQLSSSGSDTGARNARKKKQRAPPTQTERRPDAAATRPSSTRSPARRRHGRPELRHRQVQGADLPAADLPGRRHPVRHPLGGAGRDQRDRDRLRPQPERVVRRRGRLDAVPALHLEDLGRRRQPRRQARPVQPGGRDLRRRPLPQGRRRHRQHPQGRLRLQPRWLVRRLA